MRRWSHLATICAGFLIAAAPAAAEEKAEKPSPQVVNDTYPHLASGVLTFATLGDLPEGTLVRSGEVEISAEDLDKAIADAPEELQAQLQQSAFFVLEQIAAKDLLLAAAKADAEAKKTDTSAKSDQDIIIAYLDDITSDVEVTDDDVASFYEENKDLLAGATLEQVKDQIRLYLLQRERMEAIDQHVRTLGKLIPITVSSSWAKKQAALAADNPVDKARESGKPAMVQFTSSESQPCKDMEPVMDGVREKHGKGLSVVSVDVDANQVLSARYKIQSVPTQIFFDKSGEEVYRHVGFFSQDEVEKQLGEMGVK